MTNHVRRLFKRYAARHLSLEISGALLPGSTALQLSHMRLENNFLKLEGWSKADQISLTLAEVRRTARPGPDGGQFSLMVPYAADRAQLVVLTGAEEEVLDLPGLSDHRVALARARLLPGFLAGLLRASPGALRWFRHRDPAARIAVRNALGLAPLSSAGRLDERLWPKQSRTPDEDLLKAVPLVILMPVFNAFEVLGQALARLEKNTDLPWRLILVEDCSTDDRVRPFVQEWSTRINRQGGQVTLLENAENLGFIGAVNRGLEKALSVLENEPPNSSAAVVLLNSDALVPDGWASRLVAPIVADASVASVTPMSNDAELLCVPVASRRVDLSAGIADKIDRMARDLSSPAEGIGDMPTGVGFCMAMSLRFLRMIPRFDPVFGPGYGEEVDWGQKAIEHGGHHVAQPNLFVEHRGGASFGSEQKQRLLQRNGAILSQRYPAFDQQVQDFLAEDPLLTARLVLGLAMLAAQAGDRPVPVYLGHTLGGGAEMDLRRRVERHVASTGGALVLRVGSDLRWLVELHTAAGITRGETDDTGYLKRLVALLPRRRVIYSCGVGDPDPGGLPDILLALGSKKSGGWEILFHDYLPLSPSYTLLGSDGFFHGVPDCGKNDPTHKSRRLDGSVMELSQWRAAWGRLAARADSLEVFSENSRMLVAEAFPEQAEKIRLAPHDMLHDIPAIAPAKRQDGLPVIGVLGNIGSHKGAGILVRLSRLLARNRKGRLVVIGNLDPSYRLAHPAVVHGDYAPGDLPGLVSRYNISCWLIPSIWPETFSFTTHEALATGMPVFAFDLGAQGDLVARAEIIGQGGVIPLVNGEPDLQFLLELVERMADEKRDG